VTYKPWEERETTGMTQTAILADLRAKFQRVQEAIVFAFPPPAIRGLGVSGGFEMQIEDRANVGPEQLQQVTEEMVAGGNGQNALRALNTTYRAGVPQLYVDIDRVKAKSLNVPLDVVFNTLQAYLGSSYVNDFNLFGRTYQVRVQADQRFRLRPSDITRLEVRDRAGDMLPLGTLAHVTERTGPQTITRYLLYPSAQITGEAAPGFSSGQALTIMEQMARDKLPEGMGFDWTGMSYQERRVGSQAFYIFALAVALVYLVLAGLYESWITPVSVILVVPLALLGTVIAVAARGMDNNVYTQIGIVLIIALASKNAILIVEFARELKAGGMDLLEAATRASRLRFRPILMTSFAFILGIVPLVRATGAGAASRQALGTAVFGGMIASTVLAVFFVPVFYVVVERFGALLPRRRRGGDAAVATSSPSGDGPAAEHGQDGARVDAH
jgi:HAE1 family hydrophobic/amphiphilic exporter-1